MEKTLEKFKGKHFMYNTKVHQLINYKKTDEGGFIVSTDKQIFVVDGEYEQKEFASKMLEVDEPAISKELTTTPSYQAPEAFGKLSDRLMDMLEKVAENPECIDQAKAVNDTAQTMINLGKLQLEHQKAFKNGKI